MKKMVWTAAAIVLAGCSRAPADDPAVVSVWMRTLYGVMRVERLSPPVASRMLTYATSAMYSGLASADPRMPQLNGVLNDFPVVPAAQHGLFDGTITAVTAVRVVLDTLLREGLPTTRASLARLADSLGAARASLGIDGAKRALSEQRGRQIGLAIVAWSRSDGFDATRARKYVAPTGPGLWVNDAPASIYASQNLSG